jgi:hypothetical protein
VAAVDAAAAGEAEASAAVVLVVAVVADLAEVLVEAATLVEEARAAVGRIMRVNREIFSYG